MNSEEKKLIRRYLIWCYKTTKEELDRIERKFTQLKADEFILKELRKEADPLPKALKSGLTAKIQEFEVYKNKKEEEALAEKFSDAGKRMENNEILYLKFRLRGIEKAIAAFLGKSEVARIDALYQSEMIKRILEERQHR